MLLVILYFFAVIALLFFLIAAIVFISSLIFSLVKGAPYVPTDKHIINSMLEKAHLKKGMQFLELGCGTGRIVSMAVSKYGVYGVGVEVNPLLYAGAHMRKWLSKLNTVEFLRKDVRHVPFNNYNVIYLFLFPSLIEKIQDKFLTECKKGTVIISHGFRVPALKDNLTNTLKGHTFKTFFYTI